MTERKGLRILFTGASSFTGYWFVEALVAAGHDVTAILQAVPDAYSGLRARRVARLAGTCRCEFETSFGGDRFLQLVERETHWDFLCHHAALVTDYKSEDFDVAAAVANNTANLPRVLAALRGRHCDRIVITGTVFEPGEGMGSDDLPAFSPYGLSKAITWEWFRYYGARFGFRLGKFVVSNPFGAYEEARFTDYLVRTWHEGRCASVRTPEYVRDNIHVSLLARAYARFIEEWDDSRVVRRIAPMGYVERQGAFAERFALQMRSRLALACEVHLEEQTSFPEPRVRFNPDALDYGLHGWSEESAWDELAEYYQGLYGQATNAPNES